MTKKSLLFRRKLYIFRVERYDNMLDHWKSCGSVLLPENAYRYEISNALRVFGIQAPRGGDRISWTLETLVGESFFATGNRGLDQQRWPRIRISDVHNRPLVRLLAQVR